MNCSKKKILNSPWKNSRAAVHIHMQLLINGVRKGITDLCFHWAVQFGLVQYKTHFFVFPLSEGYQITVPSRNYFGHPSIGVPSIPKGPKRAELHKLQSADCKQAKSCFLSVVVELLIYHFSEFYIFLRRECYHVDFRHVVSVSVYANNSCL